MQQQHQKGKNQVFLDFFKTQLCPNIQKGYCSRGEDCNFAHSEDQLRIKPNLYKTKLCDEFMNSGNCHRGQQCHFAHGESQLRFTEDLYKTSLCYNYNAGKCQLGNKCRYAHGLNELRPATINHFSVKKKVFNEIKGYEEEVEEEEDLFGSDQQQAQQYFQQQQQQKEQQQHNNNFGQYNSQNSYNQYQNIVQKYPSGNYFPFQQQTEQQQQMNSHRMNYQNQQLYYQQMQAGYNIQQQQQSSQKNQIQNYSNNYNIGKQSMLQKEYFQQGGQEFNMYEKIDKSRTNIQSQQQQYNQQLQQQQQQSQQNLQQITGRQNNIKKNEFQDALFAQEQEIQKIWSKSSSEKSFKKGVIIDQGQNQQNELQQEKLFQQTQQQLQQQGYFQKNLKRLEKQNDVSWNIFNNSQSRILQLQQEEIDQKKQSKNQQV